MKIIKTQVTTKARKLNADWTIEEAQDVEHVFSTELQKAIDREILSQIQKESLNEKGWHKVVVSHYKLSNRIPQDWIPQNIVHGYQSFDDCWMFEDQEDAVRFALEWV